jgi:hypothetical protein
MQSRSVNCTSEQFCLAKFRQKFGEGKDRNYADCLTGQTNKEIDAFIDGGEFTNVFQSARMSMGRRLLGSQLPRGQLSLLRLFDMPPLIEKRLARPSLVQFKHLGLVD